MLGRVADHLVDVLLGEHRGRGDGDLLLLVGGLVLGRHIEDAVGVDVKGDLDLRHAARSRWNAIEPEGGQLFVVARHLALALEDHDVDRGLVLRCRREDLGMAGGDGRVAVDHLGRHAAQGLDPERERGDVQQQDILDLAAQDAGLDGGTDRDYLIGVDALVGLLAAEHGLDVLDDGRHAGHATDQDHLVDVGRLEAGIGQCLADRTLRLLDQVGDQVLELGPGQGHDQVLGARCVGADERQVDLGLGGAGQLDLRLLGGLLEALQRDAVL